MSLWMLSSWNPQTGWRHLVGSGFVMGIAAGIKFSALMMVPVVIVMTMLRCWVTPSVRSAAGRVFLKSALGWGMTVGAVIILVGLLWSRGSVESSWKAHLTGTAVPGMANREDVRFPPGLLIDHVECVAAAVLGLLLLARAKRWSELAVPLSLLLTVTAVHLFYRPWWDYYYLHFAMPLAWLAGLGIGEAVQIVSRGLSSGRFSLKEGGGWKCLGLWALTALMLIRSLGRLEASVEDMRLKPDANTNPLVVTMRAHAEHTQWVHAENPTYAFHAGLPTPPELAVVTAKRFWSGQITAEQIIEACRRREVGQVLLSFRTAADPRWAAFLADGFHPMAEDGGLRLYVSTRLLQER